MSELTFLVKLKDQLRELLPAREIPAEEPPAEPEIPAEEPPAEPETPAEEMPAEPEEAAEEVPQPAAPAKRPFPWKWLLLAAGAALLIWILFIRK